MTEEADDIRMPREGMSTLVTQYTRKELDRLANVITQLRARGQSEDTILGMMRQQLTNFDPHTLQRIYRRSLGLAIPDDFEPGNVKSLVELKSTTVRLEVHEVIGHLRPMSLVQFRGGDWFVQSLEGSTYTLKRVD